MSVLSVVVVVSRSLGSAVAVHRGSSGGDVRVSGSLVTSGGHSALLAASPALLEPVSSSSSVLLAGVTSAVSTATVGQRSAVASSVVSGTVGTISSHEGEKACEERGLGFGSRSLILTELLAVCQVSGVTRLLCAPITSPDTRAIKLSLRAANAKQNPGHQALPVVFWQPPSTIKTQHFWLRCPDTRTVCTHWRLPSHQTHLTYYLGPGKAHADPTCV